MFEKKGSRFMQTVLGFLSAFSPGFICSKCVARMMERDDTTITRMLNELVLAGDVEARHRDCFNCEVSSTVYRTRPRSL